MTKRRSQRRRTTACPAPAAAAAAPEARRPPHRARLRVAMNREQIGNESSPKGSSKQGASGDASTNVARIVLTRRASSAGRPCQARPRPKKPLWQCGIFTRHGSNWRQPLVVVEGVDPHHLFISRIRHRTASVHLPPRVTHQRRRRLHRDYHLCTMVPR